MKPYTSFDFDYTLYNPETKETIQETSKIFHKLIEDDENVCITTLRGTNETEIIRELFPEVQVFATNGFDKVFCLRKYIPFPIKTHYDDDLNVCLALLSTSIKPIWVRGKWLVEKMKEVEKLDVN